jgi:hypothetical protein
MSTNCPDKPRICAALKPNLINPILLARLCPVDESRGNATVEAELKSSPQFLSEPTPTHSA